MIGEPKRILLATDGSSEAHRAGRLAVELSRGMEAELHVVLVEPTPESIYGVGYGVFERAEKEAGEKLRTEVRRIEQAGGTVAGAHAGAGRPDAKIVAVAEEIGADLVVVGSRGLGGLRRALMGSVSLSVVRHAHCSVLVVRGGEGDEAPRVGSILLAVDGSRGSDEAGRIAAGIAKVVDSELHLIHVAPEPLVLPYDVPQEEELPPILQLARKNARTFVDEQAQRLEGMGAKVAGTHPVLGRPDVEIVAVAEEIGADLVVVGSRGLGGLRRALMGSVSDSVVRHAHCSVLVVRIPRARA